MNYKTSKETRKMFGVTTQTLYNWRKEKRIEFKVLTARNFLYDVDSIARFSKEQTPRINVIYSRVSQNKQKDDLIKQKEILVEFANKNGYTVGEIFEEMASGMNENRTKFNKLIDLVINRQVNKIFVTYKDRLTRFGFSYFDNLFKKFDTEIIVLNDDKVSSFEQELVEDLVSIIHYFSMRMYSNRRKLLKQVETTIKNNINKDKEE